MTLTRRMAALALCATLATPVLAAPCRSAGSAAAAALPELGQMTPEQMSLLVSVPFMMKLMKVDDASVRRAGVTCPRTRFEVEGVGAYTLTGDDGEKTFPRRAAPDAKGGAVVFLAPVTEIKAAMAQSRGGPAPPVSYLLATAREGAIEGFRLYDAVPDDARLQADAAEVLQARRKPFMRIPRDGQFQLLVN